MLRIILVFSFTVLLMAQTAKVQFVVGRVEFQSKGQNTWKRLTTKSRVSQGDKLKSGFLSRAEIRMPDETVIKLKENSILEINMIKENGNKKSANKLFLWAGSIWSKFKKVFSDEEENTISTTTAVAAIRGTEFGMSFNNGKTKIRLKEGKLEIRSKIKKKSVSMNAGTTVDVDQNGNLDKSNNFDKEKDDGVLESKNEANSKKNANFLELYQKSRTISDEAEVAAGIEVSGETNPESQLTINGQEITVLENGFFQHFESTFEGQRKIAIKSVVDGQTIEKSIDIFVNISAPEISIDNTEGQIFTNEPIYTMSLQATDVTPGDLIQIYVNKKQIKSGSSPMILSEPVSLSSGKNSLNIEARDMVGHSATSSLEVIYDSEPPEVRILSGLDDLLPDTPFGELPPGTPDFPYTLIQRPIYGIVLDKAPSSGIKELIIEGEKILVRPDGSFNHNINFQKIRNRLMEEYRRNRSDIVIPIRIEVEDFAGNRFIDESFNILMRALRQ